MNVFNSPKCLMHLFLWIYFLVPARGIGPPLPAEIQVKREWHLHENDKIGTIVDKISLKDPNGGNVKLSLEPYKGLIIPGKMNPDGYKYFTIDRHNRVVVAKNLADLVDTEFFVSIKADNGHFNSRVEIRVKVGRVNENFSTGLANALSPSPNIRFHGDLLPIPDVSNINQNTRSMEGPPLVHLSPGTEWTVNSYASSGAIVSRVTAMDMSNTYLEYSIEPDDLFKINQTGFVYVDEDLSEEVGHHRVKIIVKNAHNSVSEPVVIRVLPPNGITYTSETSSVSTTHSTSTTSKKTTTTVTTPSSSTGSTVIARENGRPAEVPPSTNSGLIIAPVVLILFLIAIIIFMVLKKSKLSLKSLDAKKLSVRYSSKEQQSVSKKDSNIMNGILAAVGFNKLAESASNKYETNVGGPKLLPRFSGEDKRDTLKSVNVEGDKWEFPRHRLRFQNILGEGCFGQVWKCEAQCMNSSDSEKSLVAVKTLRESAGPDEHRDLMQELRVLKSLDKHPNVVSLLGCCTDKDPIFVILEYMVNGKLQTYLKNSRSFSNYNNLHGPSACLTPRDLTIFALQVAKGMDFLSKNNIVHRDLAARNVLVGENQICKVADFGFARDVANNHVYERKSDGRLPIRWMAPESLYDNIFTTKSDVWSFGVLMWEIVTLGAVPYPGLSAGEVMMYVKEGKRLRKPDHCDREIYNLMYYCWYAKPEERLTFEELIKKLDWLIQSEVDYITLDNFPDHTYYNYTAVSASNEKL